MPQKAEQCIIRAWYQGSPWLWPLVPFSLLFRGITGLRRLWYKNIAQPTRLKAPVIIVGNITLGGTGKTPVVIALAEALRDKGFKPGILTRGYGGIPSKTPIWVQDDTAPHTIGDEALLLKRKTGCPTLASPNRTLAAQQLIADGCDIILSDDGLQHYKLYRDFEILVIDGLRRFGNGFCLPAGPLREPRSRCSSVDALICQNGTPADNEIGIQYKALEAINIQTGEKKSLAELSQKSVHAVAGIGNPEKFFSTLKSLGISYTPHAFPDHHVFKAKELAFADQDPIIMTEKDAVKCEAFAEKHWWALPIKVELPDTLINRILETLK